MAAAAPGHLREIPDQGYRLAGLLAPFRDEERLSSPTATRLGPGSLGGKHRIPPTLESGRPAPTLGGVQEKRSSYGHLTEKTGEGGRARLRIWRLLPIAPV